jgi:predicted nucleic acid-binding protein
MLVLDANILIRAVLGARVPFLLSKYSDQAEFCAPDFAFREAREELPLILTRRAMSVVQGMETLDSVGSLIHAVEFETYSPMEAIARERMARRDENDWPILATALAMNYPIWTEDTDFFGCGVATWTTDRVELYLSQVTA